MTDLPTPGPGPESELDPAGDDGYDDQEEGGDSLLDRLRGTGVGVEDPNIVGDAGPTDVPPGKDPPSTGTAPPQT